MADRLGGGPESVRMFLRPRTPDQLRGWLREVLGITVPRDGLVEMHDAPFAYLCHAFFERETPRDCVVWASRGSGKTFYAAVATLLDLIFKPGVEVLIVGGSLEQAARMFEHLRGLLGHELVRPMLVREPTKRRVELRNGSVAMIVAASERGVRGARPVKVRCDEAELIDRDVWSAVQLVPRTRVLGGETVWGTVEALSTYHRPGGLMSELVESALNGDGDRRLFRWGVVDVLERCPQSRACGACPLEPECGGKAKRAQGHVRIDDAVNAKARTDRSTWEAEMLCLRPSRRDAVYPGFDRAVHVAEFGVDPRDAAVRWFVGLDFGYRDPTAVVWGVVDGSGWLRIVDEYERSEVTLERHVLTMLGRDWPRPEWVGVDPAGAQRSSQTGLSPIRVLRDHGLRVRHRRTRVEDGLRAVRARLEPATGTPTLVVHRRCEKLIRALETYRFGEGPGAQPVKDGPDHLADALRYLVVNLDGASGVKVGAYV
jgi:hypothetical protein